MSEGRQESHQDQLGGPEFSYEPGEGNSGVAKIRIPTGYIPPQTYQVQYNEERTVLEVVPGEFDRRSKQTEALPIDFQFEISDRCRFNPNYISGYPLGPSLRSEPDERIFVVEIELPEGIQTKGELDAILDRAHLSFPEHLNIPLPDNISTGRGLKNLQAEAGMTDFERELVAVLIAEYVERTADQLGYDFTTEMKWGVVNVLAQMLTTELSPGGVSR